MKQKQTLLANYNHNFKIGDKVIFLRQAVGRETKEMIGTIIYFSYTEDFAKNRYPLALIKSNECEYGQELEYNNTIYVQTLKHYHA